MIAFPKFKKTIGLFTSKFQKQFLSQKHANHAQLEALSRDKNINFNLKNIFHFAIKNITLFPLVIVDSLCLKNLNLNQNHLLPLSINILNHRPINIILKVRVIVVVVSTIDNSLRISI